MQKIQRFKLSPKIYTLLLVALILLAIAMLGYYLGVVLAEGLPLVEAGQFFLDVDGNGTVDYVHYMEFIPNPGGPSSPLP